MNVAAAPTAGKSGSSCQAGAGNGAGGTWLIIITGGEGRATSLNTLAASSRLSTSLCSPDTEVVVTEAGSAVETVTSGAANRSDVEETVEDGKKGTGEDWKTGTEEDEEEDTGADMLKRTPASEDSTW